MQASMPFSAAPLKAPRPFVLLSLSLGIPQVSSQDPDAFDNGSVLGSPEKGAPHDAQELREQLRVLRQEREELLQLLEGAFEGLQLQQQEV